MRMRGAHADDFDAMHRIFDAVTRAGDTYVFGPDMPLAEVRDYWFGAGVRSYVCVDETRVLGMYKLVPNQRDRGSHIANASFMVAPEAQGQGVGRRMGEHCILQASADGFRAIQFNFVVATNAAAVRLWQSLGFRIVATLPAAFLHARLGYVDALVMFREI
jgi:GNAT superfamily N-acetyltransferase